MTRQSIVSPGAANTHEIEMAARARKGEGEECNFWRDMKIFDAISAAPSLHVTEPISPG